MTLTRDSSAAHSKTTRSKDGHQMPQTPVPPGWYPDSGGSAGARPPLPQSPQILFIYREAV